MTLTFPGMNPYLEASDIWPDFHGTYLMELRAHLNRALPPGYVARWDRYVWVDDEHEERLLGRPDVFVSETPKRSLASGNVALLDAPQTVELPVIDAKGQPVVRIIDARNRRVVTVIEMLSPANKSRGVDHDAYLAKRQEYLKSGTNLVEIDLLRAGQRPPVLGAATLCDYSILVSRAVDFPDAGYWPLTIRDVLPTIPIPLDPGVADVRIALQACLERSLEQGRYEEEIDYTQPAPPPEMNESDRAWLRERIRI